MKHNTWKYFGIIWSLLLLLISGCEIINPSEEIPAFISVDNFELTTGIGEGTASQKITEAFVYVGGDYLGAYSLPATFPVLKSGSQEVILFPGIKDNGIDATPEIYPFYADYKITVELTPEQTTRIQPTTEYVDDLTFTFVENFENTLQIFRDDIDEDDQTTIALIDDPAEVFEGEKSAKIVVSKDHPFFQVGSIRLNEVPTANRPVYLELNYKTEVSFEVGIYYTDNSNQFYPDFQHNINIKTEWNKIYINLTDQFTALKNFGDLRDYQIGIRAIMANENNEFLEGSRNIFVDNIKLIHF